MKSPEYLGPYRIGETLGKGGMGSVYRAKHAKTGEDVAVKLIAPQVSDEMRFRRRFSSEVDSLQRLKHPNIVKLIGYGEEQGMLFYSMEYVPGETLQERIRREKKLAWSSAIDIAIQVCAALKHAHDVGVIHRDLKPANLVIQQDGVVKLLDFGISKIFGQDQTAVGSIMGTADYMAPEQANGSGVTARTDLFALGLVMYAMLVGKPPFSGKNLTEVLTALERRDAIPLDLIDPNLPEDLVQIVMELLEKEPEKRPPTALAVMNRLKAMRAGLHRLQTLADRPEGDPPADADRHGDGPRAGETTRRRAARPPQDGGTQSGGISDGDTTVPPADTNARQADHGRSKRTPPSPADTLPSIDLSDQGLTAPIHIDRSAKTVSTGARDRAEGTVLGTAATAPLHPDAEQASGSGSRSSDSSSSDTSIGSAGQTHFQTVSDGQLREGIFTKSEPKTEHLFTRVVSIGVILVLLLIGGAMVVRSLRGPTADELLAAIEQQSGEQQSFETQNQIERFLKLFPDHPKAEELRDRQMTYRVEATLRRMKLKSKLRPSEGPLYEQAFLEAMDLRSEDPDAARRKLLQWIAVFKNSQLEDREVTVRLAELAQFEADRLAALIQEGKAVPNDPKLAELMQRIEDSKDLPPAERTQLLEGIVTLYEGQAWATQARDRAQELLGQDDQ